MAEQFYDFVSIQLDKNSKASLYTQLYDCLRELILSGKLGHGYLLPPVRKLASFLGINPGTVVSAYKLLEQNGYTYSRAGSGNYVAQIAGNAQDGPEPALIDIDLEIFENKSSAGDRPNCIDFASVMPTPDLLPIDDFKNVLIEVLTGIKALRSVIRKAKASILYGRPFPCI